MKYLLIPALIVIQGCASVVNGSDQTTSIDVIGSEGDKRDITCKLSNSKGKWTTTVHNTTTIRRSGSDMQVSCENDKTGETGNTVMVSEYKARFILPNLLIDYGIISIPTDLITGAVYRYPDNATVEMVGGE